MKKNILTGFIAIALSNSVMAGTNTNNPQIKVLTGDARTACEVILCLSSSQGKGISECKPPLRKYFSIRAKKWHKTLAKRRAFLDLCPVANENEKMSALTTVIQHQEYACDAETLNSRTESKYRRIRRWYKTQSYMPNFCKDLYNHEFTAYSKIKLPKYTCDPNKWYTQKDWNRGFERVVVSRRWNHYTDSYDVEYKDIPIKKACWQ